MFRFLIDANSSLTGNVNTDVEILSLKVKSLQDKQTSLASDLESIRKMTLSATEALGHLVNSYNALKERVSNLEKKPVKKSVLTDVI